jgi:uncharacterized protein
MRPSIFSDDNPFAQLALTILTCLSCLFLAVSIGSMFSFVFFHVHPADLQMELANTKNIPLQKFFQAIQGIGFFIVPAIILGYAFSGNSTNYLKLNQIPEGYKFILVVLVMLVSIPVINMIAGLNSMIKFPQSMSGVQNYIDQTSKTYNTITESFMKVSTLQGLGINLLIVAIIPALGEEFLFRGVFQRIFSNWTRNAHWGIVISAFIFSAIHIEFYGFFPRWILGIMFGYFLLWSGSIWLPILAHFINNGVAVITYYLISNGTINEKMADIGSTSDILPITISCCIFMGVGIYYLYKKRITS